MNVRLKHNEGHETGLCSRDGRAFSLIELLVVMGITITALAMLVPALRNKATVSAAAYTIGGIFDQARSYAVSNNTYVYVGFYEEDGAKTAAGSGPVAPGKGRVVMAMVTSKDGLSGYDTASGTWINYANGSSLMAIGKLYRLESLSIADDRLGDSIVNMARPPLDANGILITGSNTSSTHFSWPLGTALGKGIYNFQNVVCFTPQGIATVFNGQHGLSSAKVPSYLEVGLRAAHGNIPAQGMDIAIIQIDSITGANHIYRP